MKHKNNLVILLFFILSSCIGNESKVEENPVPVFDGQKAFDHVAQQVSIGPRFPGSEGHELVQNWIIQELKQYGWEVELQLGERQGKSIKNIIAYRHYGRENNQDWVILGAHYDTRMISDQDPDTSRQSEPGVGANDGASGVAVLLEVARILPEISDSDVWLVFFDAEDNGRIPGWEWVMGSTEFVESLSDLPDKVIVVDMVGDANQDIYIEKSSDSKLVAEIWQAAADLGIESFIPEPKHHILDDHTPFLMKNIPAVDIIDINYPYWHTTQDTLDKVSAQSLKNVGDVLLFWLLGEKKIAE